MTDSPEFYPDDFARPETIRRLEVEDGILKKGVKHGWRSREEGGKIRLERAQQRPREYQYPDNLTPPEELSYLTVNADLPWEPVQLPEKHKIWTSSTWYRWKTTQGGPILGPKEEEETREDERKHEGMKRFAHMQVLPVEKTRTSSEEEAVIWMPLWPDGAIPDDTISVTVWSPE
jgi:hypothetical protein